MNKNIIIEGAREGTLKNVSLEIPRDKLVVLTGLSGSGKSTLAREVLFNECQRQYLEAMGMQGIAKPDVDFIRNVSPAVTIEQQTSNKNPRSTVGTVTDIYTDLRMIYEKLHVRTCPHCNEEICAADCKEELVKHDGTFTVYMDCHKCGQRMEKITRAHFSSNTRVGGCPTCQGLGKVMEINAENVLDESLAIEDGGVKLWGGAYLDYQVGTVLKACEHFGVPVAKGTPIATLSPGQKALLLYGAESDEVKKIFPGVTAPKTVMAGKFEGIYTALWRRISEKGGEDKVTEEFFIFGTCHDCNGEKLGELSRNVTVEGIRIPELTILSLDELYTWVEKINAGISQSAHAYVDVYLLDLKTKITRLINVGLGYLSLDRQSVTLSGGEYQRVKLSATLDATITGIIYILDEPTVGLHPKDTIGMMNILKRLRDLGNTVIVIEHDPDVMEEADYVIDMGPGSGKHGGEVIGKGTLAEIKEQPSSVTGQYLKSYKENVGIKRRTTFKKGAIEVKGASMHNLENVDASFPVGCLTAVTGMSGSGKSTLVFDVLAEQHPEAITIEQAVISRMKRSNVATYSEAYAEIRKIFGDLKEAKDRGFSAKHFSFNTAGGRCENCSGLGYVDSNMMFFESIEVVCPVCAGKRFNDDVLEVKYEGYSINEILHLSVEEAVNVFYKSLKIKKILTLLEDVGLGYLELGQTLTTLSGGEGQRLKLAKELNTTKKGALYLMDEPTTGLHPIDVDNFLVMLQRMVEAGNTVIVVEHNQQVIHAADWEIRLGPEGGVNGGHVVYTGIPS